HSRRHEFPQSPGSDVSPAALLEDAQSSRLLYGSPAPAWGRAPREPALFCRSPERTGAPARPLLARWGGGNRGGSRRVQAERSSASPPVVPRRSSPVLPPRAARIKIHFSFPFHRKSLRSTVFTQSSCTLPLR